MLSNPRRGLFALIPLLCLLGSAQAQNVTQTGSVSFSPTPVTTTVPEATGSVNETVPGQGVYPPLQRESLIGLEECPYAEHLCKEVSGTAGTARSPSLD